MQIPPFSLATVAIHFIQTFENQKKSRSKKTRRKKQKCKKLRKKKKQENIQKTQESQALFLQIPQSFRVLHTTHRFCAGWQREEKIITVIKKQSCTSSLTQPFFAPTVLCPSRHVPPIPPARKKREKKVINKKWEKNRANNSIRRRKVYMPMTRPTETSKKKDPNHNFVKKETVKRMS